MFAVKICTLPSLLIALIFSTAAVHADPFQLDAQQKEYIQSPDQQATTSYPAPRMMTTPHLKSSASSAILKAGVEHNVVLPAVFMGSWLVKGQRTKVEAESQFQAVAENSFATSTTNVWKIEGDPQNGYQISSDSGINTQLWVDKVQGGTAFVRYQHPIKNTLAQEAIVMSLQPGGHYFHGLERVTIVKKGEPPRAKVTYQLVGQRR